MPLSLVREVLELYAGYNPILYMASLDARPPVEPYLHQAEFLARTLFRVPLRAFVADEIGLGKTVTAIAAAKRLWDLGLARRVLIVVPRVLVRQWVLELERLGLNPRRIERHNFKVLAASGFPEGFYVASMDLVKRKRYVEAIAATPWDVLVVDEAHRLGKSKGKGETMRYRFAEALARERERSVLLLSATPHRGDPHDYLSRLRLLDPSLTPDLRKLDTPQFYALTHNVLVFRRTKLDVNEVYEGRRVFPGCKISAVIVPATREEAEFHKRLLAFLRTKLLDFHRMTGTQPRELGLLMALMFKRASSSPYAALKTMEYMLEKRAAWLEPGSALEKELKRRGRLARAVLGLGFEEYEAEADPDKAVDEFAEACSALLSERDVEELRELVKLAKASIERDSRLSAVASIVEQHVRAGDKVIVFTEFKDTARYLAGKLEGVLGSGAVALLTSDEAAREEGLERVRRWLGQEGGRVLVATDVASEGLNLQVAGVLVNYEPPWSPVKLEQRIGRVWRLGQRRDVSVYTVFLAVESDRDVLEVLYRKLVAMGRALGKLEKPPVGEEAYVIDMEERGSQQPVVLAVKRGARLRRVTEYALRSEYIREGRQGLERLVDAIARTLAQLQRDLEKVGGYRRPSREGVRAFMLRAAGFPSYGEAYSALFKLAEALAKLRPDLVRAEGGRLFVRAPGGASIPFDEPVKALKALLAGLPRGGRAPFIVSLGGGEGEVRVYEVGVALRGGPVVYREPVGVDAGGRLLRGAELLEALAKALAGAVFEAQEFTARFDEDLFKLRSYATELLRDLTADFARYRDGVARLRLAAGGGSPLEQLEVREPRLIGVVRFTSEASFTSERELSAEEKGRIEAEAMRVAMEYERSQGREPVDVSGREHFDILSRDPRTGEVRYIEVKGHAGPSLLAELSEAEYRVARERRDRYWLYIVCNIASGKPQLVAVQDPLSRMKVEVLGAPKYLLKP
jgi:superfamily II DNA or RNA helicase